MARPTGARLLVAAGALPVLNGAAPFLLPLVYPPGGWTPHVEGLYEPVRWRRMRDWQFFAACD